MLTKRPIDGRATNSKGLCDGGRADALLLVLQNIYAWFTPLVDAGRLCLRNAFQLALLAEIGFKLSEHAQHVEKGFAGGGAGIYRLLGCLQAGPLGLYGANDVLEITNAPGQAVDSGDADSKQATIERNDSEAGWLDSSAPAMSGAETPTRCTTPCHRRVF